MAKKFNVTGEQRDDIDGQMWEIKRQLRLKSGSPIDPELVKLALQDIVEDKFSGLVRKRMVETKPRLLGSIMITFYVPATTEEFVVKDNFKVDTSYTAKVKISYLEDSFQEWFFGKTEKPFPGSQIFGRKLQKDSLDGPILQELGGQEKAETTMAEIYAMMEAQLDDKGFPLINNGRANIFYVRDISGTLRAVYLLWNGDGWFVCACSQLSFRSAGLLAGSCSPVILWS